MSTSELGIGIVTRNADSYVARFEASEKVDGVPRAVQIISLTAGKIDSSVGAETRSVVSDDTLDVTTLSGSILVGDNAYLGCYVLHSSRNGSCIVTPLLCDSNGVVIGKLSSKETKVDIEFIKSGEYLSTCLIWDIRSCGAWKIFPHVYNLSSGNSVKLWVYTY